MSDEATESDQSAASSSEHGHDAGLPLPGLDCVCLLALVLVRGVVVRSLARHTEAAKETEERAIAHTPA